MAVRASTLVLSNNILKRGKRDKVDISPMKLQKLLYYACVMYAKKTGDLPISERFEVWQSGPVLTSVHSAFEPFEARPIPHYCPNAKGEAKVVTEDRNPVLRSCLDYVWCKMKGYSAMDLAERSRQKGSGWYAAFQRYEEEISVEDMINDETM